MSSLLLSIRRELRMLLRAGGTGEPRAVFVIPLLLLFIWLCYAVLFRKRSPYPLPPGPPGRFLVGNLGQLSGHPEQDYIRWGKQYNSDVIHLKVMGQHVIGLNSVKAATDLLDYRGANYCDRPRFTLFEMYVAFQKREQIGIRARIKH